MADATGDATGDSDAERRVDVERIGLHRFRATNARGGSLSFGDGSDADFTPIEMLLAAIAGCTAIDVEYITGKRAEPLAFRVPVRADKVRDDGGNRLSNIEVRFEVEFPASEAGDAAREVLPSAIQRSHDRLCTVSRTVELGTPVDARLAD
jgi:putative redox protein